MSDLLNSASLVMIPSGYKEDVVYSQIPTDGSGDLSFTRASNGTRVNSAGLVEVCPWNLVEYSEQFDNAYWSKDNATITSNSITAPNGTTTADTFTRTSATGYVYKGSFTLGIGQFTQSVYAKANASSSIRLEFVTNAFGLGAACIFDLSNGTAGTITIYGGVSGFTASIESVGNGWYRCSLGGTLTIADTYFYELSITSGSVYIWGAQLNIGSTAKPYFPTTDRLNVPRLTYQNGGGGCPSLLLEKQSTNLALYSNALSTNPNIVDSDTTTANVYISPDGTQNAMQFTETTANDRHGFYQYTTVSAQTYTASIFTKQTGRRYIACTSNMTGTVATSYFDLQTISVVSSGSGYTCTIQDFGNGWLRLILTFTASAGNRFIIWGGSPDGTSYQYAGNTSISQTFYGYQLEASSYATSYIPTTSSSATRVADKCVKTGISSLIGQTEGTIFYQIQRNNTNNDSRLQISDGTTNNWLFVSIESGLVPRLYCNVGGVNQFSIYGSSVDNGFHKVAMAYKNNDFKVYIDGVVSMTQTSGSVPACSVLSVANTSPTSDVQSTSQIGEVIVFPTRLTNAELASLTTI